MKRKKSFLKKITLLFVLFLIIYVGHTFATNDAVRLPEKLQGFGIIKQEEHPIAIDKYGWKLMLVNRDNYNLIIQQMQCYTMYLLNKRFRPHKILHLRYHRCSRSNFYQ